jgi:hypothetical protein
VAISAGAASEPSAREPTITLSSTPNTRAATSTGRDVDQRVADADDTEREHRDDGRRHCSDERERSAPEHDSECEVAGEPLAADEPQGDGGAEQRADAARRLEQPHAGVAQVEQVERGDDDQHAERACDQALRAVEADQQPQPRLRADGPQPARKPAERITT